jgi:hypothetical protein
MKKFVMAACLGLFAFSSMALAQTTPPPAASPAKDAFAGKVKFSSDRVDFGVTKYNKPVTVQFEFTNTGTQPLIVENVQASCGCTTPTWPKEPILPQQSGKISATFSGNAMGQVNKTVWVRFQGINDDMELHLVGKVEN